MQRVSGAGLEFGDQVKVEAARGVVLGVDQQSAAADLAAGTGGGQIKSGAPARGERVAKHNRLAAIELELPEAGYGLA